LVKPVAGSVAFLILILFAVSEPLLASPIAFQADSFLWLPGTMMQTVVPLPDLVTGGTVPLGVDYLGRPDPSQASSPATVQPIDQSFTFTIREPIVQPQTNPLAGYSLLRVSGRITGSIQENSGFPPRNGGSFSGAATSITVLTAPGPIPQELLNLTSHPERIQITGVDGWLASTQEAVINVTLNIDPRAPLPAAAPEPSTAVTMVVGFIAAALMGRRTRGLQSRFSTPQDSDLP
jgi:hypothetical protein